MSIHKTVRPWWWWLNPWRYALRRDRAYEDALDIISDIEFPRKPMPFNPHSVGIAEYKVGTCRRCIRKYVADRIVREVKP
jgi:hypothetical protein